VSPTVLAVTQDLLWIGKLRNVADRRGWTVAVPQGKLDVTQMLLDDDTKLVVLDLHHPRIDPVETIRLVRGTRWDADLVCHGHHTDTARLEAARAAGARTVIPNSELERRLPGLMGGA
jgi:DNA-binding NarL/FixJ family response regulator